MEAILKARKTNHIALEMIEFQDSQFGAKLDELHSSLIDKINNNTYSNYGHIEDSKEVSQITQLIFDRLGLKTNIIVDKTAAAILPFYSNKHHIFIHDFFRGDFTIKNQEKILRQSSNKKGFVNVHKAKVGGIFSEYENLLYMNYIELVRTFKMNAAEITAVTLHELGHAFYACEYSDRLETNNQILADIAKTVFSKKDTKDLVYVYKELKTVNDKITEEEVEKLVNGNRVIAGYTWFKIIVGSVEDQLKNSKYAESSFEQMADNFAARFNYGRPLVTGLNKLHLEMGSPESSRSKYFSTRLLETFITIAVPLGAIGSFMMGLIPLGLIFAIASGVIFRGSGEDLLDYTYDGLRDRYKRVRNEYVQHLKKLNTGRLSGKEIEVIEGVLEDIELMDKFMDGSSNYRPILNSVANFVFSNARNAKSSIVEQRLLEDLAANDLFVKSAELRVLA